MTSKATKLRALFESGDHFIAAEAYSALTGRIVEHVGFKAAYLGGFACSAFHYAMPDNGIFSQVEQLDQATRIANAIDIPLVVDADTLGETVADAFNITRRYVQAGIAGFHIEDEANPKHSTYAGPLIPIADMQARIEAAVKARGNSDFVIIARCDELYPQERRGGGQGSVEEALKRGKAYAEAGADAIVFPIMKPDQSQQFADELPIPLVALGFDLSGATCTLNTGWGWMNAAHAHLEGARKLMNGEPTMPNPVPEIGDLIEQKLYDELIADWAQKTGRPAR